MNNLYRPPTIDDYLDARPHPLRKSGGRRFAAIPPRSRDLPLVSVFTIVRNARETLPQTISSIIGQSYQNIEYIVIDGASTDGTLEVIRQFEEKIDLWISEPDLGTADAASKAIGHATGDLIFWLSADDWAERDHVKHAVETLCASKADFVFGNSSYYEGNILTFTQLGDPNYATSITYQMPRLNSDSVVIKKACFDRIGLFDLRYKAASDYEWFLRLHVHGGVGFYDPRLNICHRLGGISSKHYVRALYEVRLACIQHGFSSSRATRAFLVHYIRRKLRQSAQIILPKAAYRSILRWVRAGYSSS